MKQNITIEQLEEINSNQLKKLYELTENPFVMRLAYQKEYDFEIDAHCWIEAVERITIGVMIEILISTVPKTDLAEDSIDIECDRVINTYLIEYRKNNFEFVDYENKKLCDALWDAIKQII